MPYRPCGVSRCCICILAKGSSGRSLCVLGRMLGRTPLPRTTALAAGALGMMLVMLGRGSGLGGCGIMSAASARASSRRCCESSKMLTRRGDGLEMVVPGRGDWKAELNDMIDPRRPRACVIPKISSVLCKSVPPSLRDCERFECQG